MSIAQAREGFSQRRSWVTYLVLAQLFLLANGTALLGREFASATIIFYSFFMIWPFLVDREFLDTLLQGSIVEYAIKFVVGYVAAVAAYFGIFVVALHAPTPVVSSSSVFPTMVLQFFVVVPAEEIFFRGFLPRMYNPQGKSWHIWTGTSLSNALWIGGFTLADVVSGATFSAFHYAAYGDNAIFAFLVAFFLGLILIGVSRAPAGYPFHADGKKRPLGLAIAMGIHFGFNMCALGYFIPGSVVFQ